MEIHQSIPNLKSSKNLPSKGSKKAAAADAQSLGECDPSKETKYITVADDMTPVDYGLDPELVPIATDVIVIEADKGLLPMSNLSTQGTELCLPHEPC